MQHGESRTKKPPYQTIRTNYKLLRSKMRWFSNSSTWNDPIDVTVMYFLSETYSNNHQWAMYSRVSRIVEA